MRKEYNNRWDAPLINPGFTEAEYQARKAAEAKTKSETVCYDCAELGSFCKAHDFSVKPRSVFIPLVDGREVSDAS